MATKQVLKSKEEMVKEILQAKGLRNDDKSVAIWIKYNKITRGVAEQGMIQYGLNRYKEIDIDTQKKYQVETKNGQKKVIEADSPVEALEKMVDYPIDAKVVDYKDANAVVILINGQKKSRNYYFVSKRDENATKDKKAKTSKPVDKSLVLSAKEKADFQEILKFYASIKAHSTSGEKYNYYKNKVGYIVPLDNGDSFVIDKEDIKTNFCFGYGMDGRSTYEDEERANYNARYAETNTQYFIDENMKVFKDAIALFSDPNLEHYKFNSVGDIEAERRRFKHIVSIDKNDNITAFIERKRWKGLANNFQQLSDNEVQSIIRGYKIVGARMEQRLATYLKKYGLSKLNVWTYLRD